MGGEATDLKGETDGTKFREFCQSDIVSYNNPDTAHAIQLKTVFYFLFFLI